MGTLEEHKALARRLYEEVFGRGNLDAADETSPGRGEPPSERATAGRDRRDQAPGEGLRAERPTSASSSRTSSLRVTWSRAAGAGAAPTPGRCRTPRTQLPATAAVRLRRAADGPLRRRQDRRVLVRARPDGPLRATRADGVGDRTD